MEKKVHESSSLGKGVADIATENGTGTRRVTKVIPDQGSRRGHQCSETSLTGDPSSRSVDAPPWCKLLPPRREANG